jgi:hypothetical protein
VVLCVLALLLVPTLVSGVQAEDPPPPPEWNPNWPWDPVGFYDPENELDPFAFGYDPCPVPPPIWDTWWDMYYPWWAALQGGPSRPQPDLNCDVVYMAEHDLLIIVPNDGPGDETRSKELRELARIFATTIVIEGHGTLHDMWVSGQLHGVEMDWFHPPVGTPTPDQVLASVGAMTGQDPADGADMLLAYVYAYDQGLWAARRAAVEDMVGHPMREFHYSASDVVQDACIRSGSRIKRNSNRGGGQLIKVQHRNKARGVFGVDANAVRAAVGGGTLQSATLLVHVGLNKGRWGPVGRQVGIHRLREAWVEDGVTWRCPNDLDLSNKRPDGPRWKMGTADEEACAYEPTATSVVTHTNDTSGWVKYDVTADLEGFLAGTHELPGWILRLVRESRSGGVCYDSRESATASLAPYLEIEVLAPAPR